MKNLDLNSECYLKYVNVKYNTIVFVVKGIDVEDDEENDEEAIH